MSNLNDYLYYYIDKWPSNKDIHCIYVANIEGMHTLLSCMQCFCAAFLFVSLDRRHTHTDTHAYAHKTKQSQSPRFVENYMETC